MKIAELKDRYPRRFDKLFEEWRDHELFGDWYESVLEFAQEDGAERGFIIDTRRKNAPRYGYPPGPSEPAIYWSGFWNQGDGASWEGHVDIPKWIEWMRAERQRALDCGPCRPGNGTPFTDEQLLWIDEGYRIDWLEARMQISVDSEHYSHSGMMSLETETHWADSYDTEVPEGIFAGMPVGEFVTTFDSLVGAEILVRVLAAAREFADEIYHNLEQEYEYLTSEEQFMESVADEEYEDEEA